MKRAMLIAAAFWMVSAGRAWPMDQIFTSTSEKPYFGKIISTTATVINFEPQLKTGPGEIPVNEIKRIVFENSPDALLSAQRAMLDGEYEKAINVLKNERVEDKRREVAEEIAFCRAYCAAQLALSGAVNPLDAAREMFAFLTSGQNSYHYYNACELMGDICVTLGKFTDAEKYYAKLSQAPWPDCKIRAQVALGRSYLAQDNAAAADKAFEDALVNDAPGELAEVQRTAARIGKARCLVLKGKTDLALHSLSEIIDRAEEKHADLNAMAYNALGTAQRKARQPEKAILAFLHVHLMYSAQPDLDAEAVANLEKLFTETHKPNHARDMREILDEKYKNSRWAKGVK